MFGILQISTIRLFNGERTRRVVQSLTNRYIDYMNEDLDALSILKPNFEPRATEFIPQIIEMISDLIEEGYAYLAANGDVYYRTRRFKNYGELSGERLDDLRAGSRIAPDEAKDDVVDFVLWKSSKPNEPKWESPWGDGRPGWHIECSVMSTSLLGNHFDIHGGGMDLLFHTMRMKLLNPRLQQAKVRQFMDAQRLSADQC